MRASISFFEIGALPILVFTFKSMWPIKFSSQRVKQTFLEEGSASENSAWRASLTVQSRSDVSLTSHSKHADRLSAMVLNSIEMAHMYMYNDERNHVAKLHQIYIFFFLKLIL